MTSSTFLRIWRPAAALAGLGVAWVARSQAEAPDEIAAQSPEILYGGAIGALLLLVVAFAVMVGTDRASRRKRSKANPTDVLVDQSRWSESNVR